MKQGKKHQPKLIINATADEVLNFALKPKKESKQLTFRDEILSYCEKEDYEKAAELIIKYFVNDKAPKSIQEIPNIQADMVKILTDRKTDIERTVDWVIMAIEMQILKFPAPPSES